MEGSDRCMDSAMKNEIKQLFFEIDVTLFIVVKHLKKITPITQAYMSELVDIIEEKLCFLEAIVRKDEISFVFSMIHARLRSLNSNHALFISDQCIHLIIVLKSVIPELTK